MVTAITAIQMDPVCGIQLDPGRSAASSEHAGEMYRFCCRECKASFDMNRDEFVESEGHGRCGRQG